MASVDRMDEVNDIAPMTKVAEMVEKHLYGIINAIVLKRTNGHAESANAKIRKVKARACGFRIRERFRTPIMFHCGRLDLCPRNADRPWPTRSGEGPKINR